MQPEFQTYNALVFARFNSSRLPGKVLFSIGGNTVIGLCINKLRLIRNIRTIVATSTAATDDPIAHWCSENDVLVFRGDLDNVARRTEACLKKYPCEAFFRINADSPFLQIDLLHLAMQRYEGDSGIDVVSNVVERSYPYGIAVELINTETYLRDVAKFAGDETEHITSYFYKKRNDFRIEVIRNQQDLSRYRFVLDTSEDWRELQELYKNNSQIFNKTISELITINKGES